MTSETSQQVVEVKEIVSQPTTEQIVTQEQMPTTEHDFYGMVDDFHYKDLIALPAVQQFCKALEIKSEAFMDFHSLHNEFIPKLGVCVHEGCRTVSSNGNFDRSFGFTIDGKPAFACDQHFEEAEHLGVVEMAVFSYDSYDADWQVAVLVQRGG